jgi:peptidoglycan/LPS O-acetylase OafA/YrhL
MLVLMGWSFWYVLSVVGQGDLLAIGALGALACQRFGAAQVEKALRPLLLISVPAVVCCVINAIYPVLPFALLLSVGYPIGVLSFLWLVVRAERDGPTASSWGGSVLPAIGRISYGIYVWHLVLLSMAQHLQSYGLSALTARTACLVATFLFATLSYHLFERPLRSLGRKITAGPIASDLLPRRPVHVE